MGDKILLLWTVKNFEKFIPITKYPEISRWKFFQLLNYNLDKKKIVKKEKKRKGWKITEYIYQIAIIRESLFSFLGVKLYRFNFFQRFHKRLLNERKPELCNQRKNT